MKYQISVDHDFGKEMDRKLAADQDVKQISNFDGGEIMMVAFGIDPETDCPDAVLLMEGNLINFIRAKLYAWQEGIDCIRFGWPKNLEVTEG